MGGDPDVLQSRRSRIESGELFGPHLFLAGPFLARGKSDKQTIAVSTPEEARHAVDAVKRQGRRFRQDTSNIPRDAYFAIADEAAKQKISFVGHVPYSVSAREAVTAGQKSIEHLTGILLACSSARMTFVPRRLTALASRDYAVTRNLASSDGHLRSDQGARVIHANCAEQHLAGADPGVDPGNSRIDDPNLESDPRLKYVPVPVREQWNPATLLKSTSPEELAELKVEAAPRSGVGQGDAVPGVQIHGRQRRSGSVRVPRV